MRPLGILLWLLLCSSLTTAQIATIAIDEPVQGEITVADAQQRYQFLGEADDVLIITLQAVDPWGTLRLPQVRLLDTYTNEMFTSAAHTGHFGRVTHMAVLVVQLPISDRFFIEAGRLDDDSTGAYTLNVERPETLTPDVGIQRTLSSNAGYHYYLARSTTAVTVRYVHETGFYHPEVRVNRVSADNELVAAGYLGGDALVHGVLGGFPMDDANPYYIISVGRVTNPVLTDEFYFAEQTATYTLTQIE